MVVKGLNKADVDVRARARGEEALTAQGLHCLRPDELYVSHTAAISDEIDNRSITASIVLRVELCCAAQNKLAQATTAPKGRECE
jgi:hypothetical protein